MIIQDNVIRHHLRNVYFICGNACAGKTTMAKMLAEKHGFALYDMDKMYEQHRAIADEQHQPDTCYHMRNFHEQWMRPAEEQARWNMNSLHEQTDMALVDLMQMSQNRVVVADVLYSPMYTRDIVADDHFVFLSVNPGEIRRCYFQRPEKRGFYEFVRKQPLAEVYFENIFRGLELTNQLEQKAVRKSGLKVIKRRADDTREITLRKIEAQFRLS